MSAIKILLFLCMVSCIPISHALDIEITPECGSLMPEVKILIKKVQALQQKIIDNQNRWSIPEDIEEYKRLKILIDDLTNRILQIRTNPSYHGELKPLRTRFEQLEQLFNSLKY